LNIRRPGAQAATTARGHGSPPTTSVRRAGSGSWGSAASIDAGISTAVIARSSSVLSSGRPGRRSSRRASTSAAPANRVMKISEVATSKQGEATCKIRSDPSRPYVSTSARARFASERCSTMTPFGTPVEPEV